MRLIDWNEIDQAIDGGSLSMDIWLRIGRAQGISLESIVKRRLALRPNVPQRKTSNLPLFTNRRGWAVAAHG